MIDERIGIIGNIQGVNERRIPKPKKLSRTIQTLPFLSVSVIKSCSESSLVSTITDFFSILTLLAPKSKLKSLFIG